MNRYTIWRKGACLGTYEGATETEALDKLCQAEGHADFEDSNAKLGLTRDDYSVRKIS